jgi:3D (Asp-Asp-Asp) domain-containing protein
MNIRADLAVFRTMATVCMDEYGYIDIAVDTLKYKTF